MIHHEFRLLVVPVGRSFFRVSSWRLAWGVWNSVMEMIHEARKPKPKPEPPPLIVRNPGEVWH